MAQILTVSIRLETIAYSAGFYVAYGSWLANGTLGLTHSNGAIVSASFCKDDR